MAKKPSTVYLEEKFWDMIVDYQTDNDLSSRNDALQLILQEWDILRKIDFNNIKINVVSNNNIVSTGTQTVVETKKSIEPKNNAAKDKKKEIVDPRITNGLLKIANSMKPEE